MFTKVVARRTTDWLVQGGQVAEDERVVAVALLCGILLSAVTAVIEWV